MHLARIILVVLLAQQVLSQKGLNSSVVLSQCATQCSWNTPAIWDNGIVPAPTDNVDIQVSGNYKIVVDSDVTIADFEIGFDDDKNGVQYFVVTNGAKFTSTGNFKSFLSVSLQVDSGASLSTTGQGTVNGHFTLAGLARFGGSTPSLLIDSTDIQFSFSFVTGELEFHNGTLVVANNLQISLTSTLSGSGNINGSVQMNGYFEPGLNGVGSFNIQGDLYFATASKLEVDVASLSSFDEIILSGTCDQSGTVVVSPSGDYEPLAHTQFIVLKYSGQRGGFDIVRGEGFLGIINNKWQAVVDQSYTALLYDSASSVVISFVLLGTCLFLALL